MYCVNKLMLLKIFLHYKRERKEQKQSDLIFWACLLTLMSSPNMVGVAVCCFSFFFAPALFVALCWPRVRSVRRREQPSSVCLPGRVDTVAAAQTADSCIFLASSICYLETSDFITADRCSCTLWLSPGLFVCLLVSLSLGRCLIGFWRAC